MSIEELTNLDSVSLSESGVSKAELFRAIESLKAFGEGSKHLGYRQDEQWLEQDPTREFDMPEEASEEPKDGNATSDT